MKRNKTLDWTAISVVALTFGGVAVTLVMNWQFTVFFLIPLLAMVVAIGWVIGWASIRCWRLWDALDREEEGSNLAKVATIVAAMLLIASPPAAKAIDDNLMGGYAGIYTRMAPTLNIYWGNYLRQLQYAWHANDPSSSRYDGR
jgi:hypothetical protein